MPKEQQEDIFDQVEGQVKRLRAIEAKSGKGFSVLADALEKIRDRAKNSAEALGVLSAVYTSLHRKQNGLNKVVAEFNDIMKGLADARKSSEALVVASQRVERLDKGMRSLHRVSSKTTINVDSSSVDVATGKVKDLAKNLKSASYSKVKIPPLSLNSGQSTKRNKTQQPVSNQPPPPPANAPKTRSDWNQPRPKNMNKGEADLWDKAEASYRQREEEYQKSNATRKKPVSREEYAEEQRQKSGEEFREKERKQAESLGIPYFPSNQSSESQPHVSNQPTPMPDPPSLPTVPPTPPQNPNGKKTNSSAFDLADFTGASDNVKEMLSQVEMLKNQYQEAASSGASFSDLLSLKDQVEQAQDLVQKMAELSPEMENAGAATITATKGTINYRNQWAKVVNVLSTTGRSVKEITVAMTEQEKKAKAVEKIERVRATLERTIARAAKEEKDFRGSSNKLSKTRLAEAKKREKDVLEKALAHWEEISDEEREAFALSWPESLNERPKQLIQHLRTCVEFTDGIAGGFEATIRGENKAVGLAGLFEEQLKKGREEASQFNRVFGGTPVGMAAAGAALFYLAEQTEKLGKGVLESKMRFVKFRQEMAIASSIADDFWPGGPEVIEGIGKSMGLTIEETAELAKVISDMGMSMGTVKALDTAIQGMYKTLGHLPVEKLREMVNLFNQLPSEVVDFAVHGTGTMDEQASAIMALSQTGNLKKVIELQASGAFGKVEIAGLNEEGKEHIKAIKQLEATSQRVEERIAESLGEQFPYIMKMSEYITSGVAILAGIATTLVTLNYLTQQILAKTGAGNAGMSVGGGKTLMRGAITTAAVVAATYAGSHLMKNVTKNIGEEEPAGKHGGVSKDEEVVAKTHENASKEIKESGFEIKSAAISMAETTAIMAFATYVGNKDFRSGVKTFGSSILNFKGMIKSLPIMMTNVGASWVGQIALPIAAVATYSEAVYSGVKKDLNMAEKTSQQTGSAVSGMVIGLKNLAMFGVGEREKKAEDTTMGDIVKGASIGGGIGALIGGTIGTFILPVLGTAMGATIGAGLGGTAGVMGSQSDADEVQGLNEYAAEVRRGWDIMSGGLVESKEAIQDSRIATIRMTQATEDLTAEANAYAKEVEVEKDMRTASLEAMEAFGHNLDYMTKGLNVLFEVLSRDVGALQMDKLTTWGGTLEDFASASASSMQSNTDAYIKSTRGITSIREDTSNISDPAMRKVALMQLHKAELEATTGFVEGMKKSLMDLSKIPGIIEDELWGQLMEPEMGNMAEGTGGSQARTAEITASWMEYSFLDLSKASEAAAANILTMGESLIELDKIQKEQTDAAKSELQARIDLMSYHEKESLGIGESVDVTKMSTEELKTMKSAIGDSVKELRERVKREAGAKGMGKELEGAESLSDSFNTIAMTLAESKRIGEASAPMRLHQKNEMVGGVKGQMGDVVAVSTEALEELHKQGKIEDNVYKAHLSQLRSAQQLVGVAGKEHEYVSAVVVAAKGIQQLAVQNMRKTRAKVSASGEELTARVQMAEIVERTVQEQNNTNLMLETLKNQLVEVNKHFKSIGEAVAYSIKNIEEGPMVLLAKRVQDMVTSGENWNHMVGITSDEIGKGTLAFVMKMKAQEQALKDAKKAVAKFDEESPNQYAKIVEEMRIKMGDLSSKMPKEDQAAFKESSAGFDALFQEVIPSIKEATAASAAMNENLNPQTMEAAAVAVENVQKKLKDLRDAGDKIKSGISGEENIGIMGRVVELWDSVALKGVELGQAVKSAEEKLKSAIATRFDEVQSQLDNVGKSSSVLLTKQRETLAEVGMSLAQMSQNSADISSAGKEYREAVIASYEEQMAQQENYNKRAIESAKAVRDEAVKKAKTEEEIAAANNRFSQTELMTQEKMKRLELERYNTVYKTIEAEAEAGSKRISQQQELIDIQKDLAVQIGAPFETILALEQETVNLKYQEVAIAQKMYDDSFVNLKAGKITQEQMMQSTIKLRKAEAAAASAAIGAQRSALEKMLGGFMSSFTNVGITSGPTRARRFGAGYTTQGGSGGFVTSAGKEGPGYNERLGMANIKGGMSGKMAGRLGISASRMGEVGELGIEDVTAKQTESTDKNTDALKGLTDALSAKASAERGGSGMTASERIKEMSNDIDARRKARGKSKGGLMSYLAAGGEGVDWSSKGTDTIPAMLSPGEFVVPADAVEYYGLEFMEMLQEKGLVLPGYHSQGGLGKIPKHMGKRASLGKIPRRMGEDWGRLGKIPRKLQASSSGKAEFHEGLDVSGISIPEDRQYGARKKKHGGSKRHSGRGQSRGASGNGSSKPLGNGIEPELISEGFWATPYGTIGKEQPIMPDMEGGGINTFVDLMKKANGPVDENAGMPDMEGGGLQPFVDLMNAGQGRKKATPVSTVNASSKAVQEGMNVSGMWTPQPQQQSILPESRQSAQAVAPENEGKSQKQETMIIELRSGNLFKKEVIKIQADHFRENMSKYLMSKTN